MALVVIPCGYSHDLHVRVILIQQVYSNWDFSVLTVSLTEPPFVVMRELVLNLLTIVVDVQSSHHDWPPSSDLECDDHGK